MIARLEYQSGGQEEVAKAAKRAPHLRKMLFRGTQMKLDGQDRIFAMQRQNTAK